MGARKAVVGLAFRQAKVEHLDAGFRQHHIAGFQIAMNDSLGVCGGEGVGHLHGVAKRLVKRQSPPGQTRRDCFAVDQLHDKVVGSNVYSVQMCG